MSQRERSEYETLLYLEGLNIGTGYKLHGLDRLAVLYSLQNCKHSPEAED